MSLTDEPQSPEELLKEEIKSLKKDLLNREARLMAMQTIVNHILTGAENETNRMFKDVITSVTNLAGLLNPGITTNLNTQLQSISTLTPQQQQKLSNDFRIQEELNPILLED